ncbi:nose resistant to fluoxetine protein 6-like [Diorhabda carinulata]|uniref:nose resistant to fluoxetine protein 6-like n=1 Tax=Diorhabda carinulata TaxID=1163345 RepID=UPI0025A2AB74|nr:nose resistant to fluoxetine protein 6-like [Diorhabda carinulata]
MFITVSIYNEFELLKKLRSISTSDGVSTQCRLTISLFLNKLNDTNDLDGIWALQMFDASSKIPAGVMSYNLGELGNFEQCIEINSINDHIIGKYCLGHVIFNRSLIENNRIYSRDHIYLKNIMLHVADGYNKTKRCSWALCLPSNCSDNDAEKILEGLDTLGLTSTSVTCQTLIESYPKLDTDAIIGITILCLYMFIVITSTAIDLGLRSKRKVMIHPIFVSFSIYTNGKILFDVPKRTSKLSCLDGLRFISMLWIIFKHVYMVYQEMTIINFKNFIEFTEVIYSMLLIRGTLACDTFLLIGGILVTYVFFDKNIKNKMTFIEIMKHYLHRYIRLTPALAASILVFTTLGKYMGSGPHWSILLANIKNCRNYWWSSILYVQNQVNVEEMDIFSVLFILGI